jgi:hypothetical protein
MTDNLSFARVTSLSQYEIVETLYAFLRTTVTFLFALPSDPHTLRSFLVGQSASFIRTTREPTHCSVLNPKPVLADTTHRPYTRIR